MNGKRFSSINDVAACQRFASVAITASKLFARDIAAYGDAELDLSISPLCGALTRSRQRPCLEIRVPGTDQSANRKLIVTSTVLGVTMQPAGVQDGSM